MRSQIYSGGVKKINHIFHAPACAQVSEFRQFSSLGLEAAAGERCLVCLAFTL